MRRFYFVVICTFLMLNLVGQNRIDRPLNWKISKNWLDTLKKYNGGENWTIKDASTFLSRTESPFWIKDNDHVYAMDTPNEHNGGQRRPTTLLRVDLSNNKLTGALADNPIYEWQRTTTEGTFKKGIWTHWTEYYFSYNQLTSVTARFLYPADYGGIYSGKLLAFDHNQITEFNIPPRLGSGSMNVHGVTKVYLNNNKLSKYNPDWEYRKEYLWWLKCNAEFLRIENNLFNFHELKKFKEKVDATVGAMATPAYSDPYPYKHPDWKFTYAPQLPQGEASTSETLSRGDNINLSFSLPDAGNKYIWELNGKEIPLSESKNFSVQINDSNAGMYRCKVTNEALPELTIYSNAHMRFLKKDGNQAPTGFNINVNRALSNTPQWSVIGEFGGEDPDNDKLYFRLVDFEGDNADFRIIDGNTLVSSTNLFEWSYKTEYTIRVQAYDIYGGTLDKEITIEHGEANSPVPTGVQLSNNSIDENKVGKIGYFKLFGVKTADFTFELPDKKDNSFFTTTDSTLKTKIGLNYEKQKQYTVRIKAVNGDVSIVKDFVIDANNINDAPSGLLLTSNEIQIGKDPGTLIGLLVGTDDDPDDTDFVYSTNSGDFLIRNKNQLQSKKMFTRAELGTIKIKVKVKDDEDAESEYNLDIDVVDNPDPSEARIILDNYIVSENTTGKVGNLSVNQGGDYEYKLVSGEGSSNNDMFDIVGTELQLKDKVDYEAVQMLSVRVKAGDIETAIDITVENVNEAPTVIGLTNFIVIPDWGVGTEIAKVVLGDEDSGKGVFTLGTEGDNSYFTIDQNVLKLNREIGDHDNKFTITVVASDGEFDYSQEFELYVPTESNGTNIIDINDITSTRVYPNPVNGTLNVNISSSYSGDVILELYSLSGLKVLRHQFTKQNGDITEVLNTGDIKSGVYILRVNQGTNQSTIQIIKR